MDGGEGRFDNAADGRIVKADDGDIFRNRVAELFEGLHGAYRDQVIVRKIAGGKLLAGAEDLPHVRTGAFDGRRQIVHDAFGSGHAAVADGVVEAGGTLREIADRVGGTQVAGLLLGRRNRCSVAR